MTSTCQLRPKQLASRKNPNSRDKIGASSGCNFPLLTLDPKLRVARRARLKHQMKGMFGGH
jgi:hypothetical protein